MNRTMLLLLSVSTMSWAEMKPMDEAELEELSGQAGITLSAKADFAAGTRISYTNKDADYKDSTEYWQIGRASCRERVYAPV